MPRLACRSIAEASASTSTVLRPVWVRAVVHGTRFDRFQQVLKLHVHCQCWCIAQQRRSLMQLSGGLYFMFGVPIDS